MFKYYKFILGIAVILIIVISAVSYFREIKIIYYKWRYKLSVITIEKGAIINKIAVFGVKPSELQENSYMRFDLENYYLSIFPATKENIKKYLGEPIIFNYSNEEYFVYWSRYFVFDKEGNLIRTEFARRGSHSWTGY